MAPPPPSSSSKKKKGPSPAHQNTTAWRHNPKSKRTATILSTPIEHVCRRCQAKLLWRKQYRKYKPRTVLGKCNHCQQKNIRAAYHTICDTCSCTSSQSLHALQQYFADEQQLQNTADDTPSEETHHSSKLLLNRNRICCICVKEPALLETEGEHRGARSSEIGNSSVGESRPLRLREVRTIERQRQRQQAQGRQRKKTDPSQTQESNGGDSESQDTSDRQDSFDEEIDEEGDDELEDPFLQAVGGIDQLLVGEAYQIAKLDEEMRQKLALSS